MNYFSPSTWSDVSKILRCEPSGSILRLPKHCLPHPVDDGAIRSVGLPMGQSADFRFRLEDCTGLHVRDFQTHYEAHIDAVDPSCNLIEHLRQDAPKTYTGAAAGIGALLGLMIGESKEAALLGAGIGALIGAATLPDSES